MKTNAILSLLALVTAASTLAQDAPAPATSPEPAAQPAAQPAGNRGPRMGGDRGFRMGGDRGPRMGGDRGPRMGMGGMGMGGMGGDASDFQIRMFTRMITRPQVAQELGLSEELVQEITKAFEDIDVKIAALQEVQAAAQTVQTELLAADPIDEEAVLKALDEVWSKRHDIAKLQMQKMLLVFSKLTPEQAAKAREFMARPRMPQRPGAQGPGGAQGGQPPMPFGPGGPQGGQPPQMPFAPQPPAGQQ